MLGVRFDVRHFVVGGERLEAEAQRLEFDGNFQNERLILRFVDELRMDHSLGTCGSNLRCFRE